MHLLPREYDARAVEASTRALWNERSLPPPEGPLGPPGGSLVRLVSAPIAAGPAHLATALRLTRLDAEERVLLRGNFRPFGTLRPPIHGVEPGTTPGEDPVRQYGVWLGGGVLRRTAPREIEVRRTLLERLAADGILVTRSVPVRICPTCRRPHSPESVIYQEEVGSAYYVRFALRGADPPTSLLVWTDAAWKLLATTALLVNPDLPYAVVRVKRKDREERILLLKSAVERLRSSLYLQEVEILEEKPGSALVGAVYVHPLVTEHPAVADLPAPGGTLVAAARVADQGTGVLTLTPAHGVADAEVAKELSIPGWPIVGSDGVLTKTIQHKYAGLPLEDAEAFILRDLIDDGSVFAQVPARRGVPRCAQCGTALLWAPAKLWSLDIAKLPADRLAAFRRALPGVAPPSPEDAPSWPASEFAAPDLPGALPLAECSNCERLAPETAAGPCECGGTRHVVERRLLPEFEEALAAWATVDSFPDGTPVRLFVPERRRGPALFHHLVAMQAARRRPGELRVIPLLSLPTAGPALGPDEPIDGLRVALLRTTAMPAGRLTLEGHRRREAARLRRVWATCADLLPLFESAPGSADAGPIGPHLAGLLEEDRAFLSSFERVRADIVRAYELGDIAGGLDRLLQFFETDLCGTYLRLVTARISTNAPSDSRLAALRVLYRVLPSWIRMYAVAAPFTGEALWDAFRSDGRSVFESNAETGPQAPIDPEAEASYRRWSSLAEALRRGRTRIGLKKGARIPALTIVTSDEGAASALRSQTTVLLRLLGADSVEVTSPQRPWTGWKLDVRPLVPELQRAFGAQTPRILRMLQGLPAKRLQDGLRAGSVSLALEGNTLVLKSNFFEVTETLPPGVVPIPWSSGQLLVTLPAEAAPETLRPPPWLSLDAFRLMRAMERRLRPLPLDAQLPEIVVRAGDPLGAEIATQTGAIARYLHVPSLRVALPGEELRESETIHGRTGRGVAWSFQVPGFPKPVAAKKTRRGPTSMPRAPIPAPLPIVPEDQMEFLSESLRARETGVRELLEKLDAIPAGATLGPAKLTELWEVGVRTPEGIAQAPFEQVAALPGFGVIVAREVVRAVGGDPPPSLPRPRRVVPALQPTQVTVNEPELFEGLPPPVQVLAASIQTERPSPIRELPTPAAAPSAPLPVPKLPETPVVPAPPVEPEPEDQPTSPPSEPSPPVLIPAAEPSTPVEEPPPAVEVNAAPEVDAAPSAPEERPEPEAHEAAAVPDTVATEVAPDPLVEAAPPAAALPPPEEGIQLVASDTRSGLWERFLEATSAGHKGLCVSRESPDRLKIYLGDRDVQFAWISPVARPGALRPSDLVGISQRIRLALEEQGVTAVYLEGIEYLVSLHSAERTLPTLQELDALARGRHARIWIPVNPGLLPAPELERLSTGLGAGSTPAPPESATPA